MPRSVTHASLRDATRRMVESSQLDCVANLTDDERESIDKALEETNEWLDDHQDADKEALDEKLAELKDHVNPAIKLAYERSGVKKPGGADEYGVAGDDGMDDHDEL